MVAARAAGTAPPDYVFMPDAFDVTVPPGEDLQVAVDRCPPGGSVLLLPGTHEGPLVLGRREKGWGEEDGEGEGEEGGEKEKASDARKGGPPPVDKEVHIFGRGLATLRTSGSTVVSSTAARSTVDGLIIRLEDSTPYVIIHCLSIRGGRLRLQACDISSGSGIEIDGGADPVVINCKCVCVMGAMWRGAGREGGTRHNATGVRLDLG